MASFADTIITNAHVFTADADQPKASAVATRGKHIVYVGDELGAREWKDARTRVINGIGRTLMPGIIDSHFHMQHGSLELDKIHFEACIQNYDFSIIFGSYEDNSPRMIGDFDMLIYDRSLGIEPQGSIANDYKSTQIPTKENPTGGNYWRWVNPAGDAFIEQAGSTFDLTTRKAAYCGLGELLMKDLPQIYIYVFQDGYGYANNLTGYVVSTWGSMTWDVQNWQLTGQ